MSYKQQGDDCCSFKRNSTTHSHPRFKWVVNGISWLDVDVGGWLDNWARGRIFITLQHKFQVVVIRPQSFPN